MPSAKGNWLPAALSLGLIAIACSLAAPVPCWAWNLELNRLGNAPVRYAGYSSLLAFPVPAVAWKRPGLAGSAAEIERVKSEVLYPIIIHSTKAVSSIVVEYLPADPKSIGVMVIWADGESRGALLSKNEEGGFDPAAYRIFFAKPVP